MTTINLNPGKCFNLFKISVTFLLLLYSFSSQSQVWSSFYCTPPQNSVDKLASNGTDLDYASTFVSPEVYQQTGSQFPYGCFNNTAIFPYIDMRALEYYNNVLYATGLMMNTDSCRIYNAWGNIGSVDGWVNCLLSFNGSLYAAGGFNQINGIPATNIAKWNGTSWSAVGAGLTSIQGGFIKSIAVHNNQLYASLSTPLSNLTEIFYFNGTNWILIGTAGSTVGSQITSMKSYNGSLYVGGNFTSVNSILVSNIARWNGVTWSALGTGITNPNGVFVLSMEVYNSILYVGGIFNNAGGLGVSNIATWNGTTWSSPGTGMNSTVTSLLNYKGSLIAGGDFTTVNGQLISHLARYTACPITLTTSGPLSFCGGNVTLTAPAGSNYQWKKNGVSIAGATNASYIATTTGNYFCVFTGGCGTTYTNSVSVNAAAPPTASITAGGSTSFCTGGSVLLSANTGIGLTYQWKNTGATIPGATSSTYLATASGSYNCYISNSCSGINSNTLSVTNNTPVAYINPSGSTTTCSGTPKLLTTNAAGGISKQWKLNGTAIAGATNYSYSATLAGNYTVVLTYMGCSATSPATTLSIVNLPGQPGSITTVGGVAKVCPGTVKSYSIPAVTGATSYNWIAPVGGTITAGQGTPNVTVNYTAAFVASDTIRVAAINSCGTGAYRILKITRNTPSTPGVITGLLYGVCGLNNVAYSVPNVAGMTYNWYFNGAGATIVNGQTTSTIAANFNGYVTGTLNVYASNGCGNSAIRTTTVRATPAKPVAMTGPVTACANQQNVPYSIAAVPYTTNYTWVGPTGSHISDGVNTSVTNTLITTATAVTVDYGTAGGTLKVRANNTCGSGTYLSTTIVINCRIQQDEISDNFIYPNPVVDQLIVNYPGMKDVKIFDVTGKLLLYSQLAEGEILDLSALSSGIYICEIRSNDELIYKGKIVKE